MAYLKPLIKRSHHVIVSDEGHIGIGEIPGHSGVIRNAPAWVADALRLFDGSSTVQRIHKEVAARHPSVLVSDVESLVESLAEASLLEAPDDDLGDLTPRERERYDRQILQYMLTAGTAPAASIQAKLKASTAVVFGMGGWGTWLCLHLALNGFGTLRIVDGDTVERSNLNRQVLYDESQLGKYKVDAAAEALGRQNALVDCETYAEFATIDEERLEHLMTGATVVFVAWASLDFYRKNTVTEKIHRIAARLRIPVCGLGGDPMAISVGPIYPYDRELLAYDEIKKKNKSGFYHEDPVIQALQRARMKNQFGNGRREVNAWQSSPSLSMMAGMLTDQAIKYLTGYADCAIVGKRFCLDMTTLGTQIVDVL